MSHEFPNGTPLPVLHSEIAQCNRCRVAGFIPEARPLMGTVAEPMPFMVIGQAPSRTDHECREFYCGPAGRKLRSWFVDAGFAESDFGSRIYPSAITKCFPGRLPGSSKDRLPSRTEQGLCRSWLDAELELVNPRVLILFGGLAIKTFLSDASLSELIGYSFESEGRIVLPLPHSSGASTWLNAPENRERLKSAISLLSHIRESL